MSEGPGHDAGLRVALVHDWLTGLRGGEKVLLEHARMFPAAEIHTLIHRPGASHPELEARNIHAGPLSRLPGAARHYRKMLPLLPWAASRLAPRNVDLVLSTSHAVAKAVRPPPGARHLCVCFTPMRYLRDQAEDYLGRGLRRAAAAPLAAGLRAWDRKSSHPRRLHRIVAISQSVAERIRRHWGREARVIHPPVEVAPIAAAAAAVSGPGDFFLLVGGFTPYKREDLALAAFAELGLPLVVAGDGPSRPRLQARAPKNARFLGRVSDAELARLYARCRGLIYPQREDFGLVAVEAQAAGRPVAAFASGGAKDSVIPLDDPAGRAPTGVFFAPQTAAALAAAVRQLEARRSEFEPAAIRRHARRFAPERYRSELREEIAALLAERPPPA